jgi:hypothetical protein
MAPLSPVLGSPQVVELGAGPESDRKLRGSSPKERDGDEMPASVARELLAGRGTASNSTPPSPKAKGGLQFKSCLKRPTTGGDANRSTAALQICHALDVRDRLEPGAIAAIFPGEIGVVAYDIDVQFPGELQHRYVVRRSELWAARHGPHAQQALRLLAQADKIDAEICGGVGSSKATGAWSTVVAKGSARSSSSGQDQVAAAAEELVTTPPAATPSSDEREADRRTSPAAATPGNFLPFRVLPPGTGAEAASAQEWLEQQLQGHTEMATEKLYAALDSTMPVQLSGMSPVSFRGAKPFKAFVNDALLKRARAPPETTWAVGSQTHDAEDLREGLPVPAALAELLLAMLPSVPRYQALVSNLAYLSLRLVALVVSFAPVVASAVCPFRGPQQLTMHRACARIRSTARSFRGPGSVVDSLVAKASST